MVQFLDSTTHLCGSCMVSYRAETYLLNKPCFVCGSDIVISYGFYGKGKNVFCTKECLNNYLENGKTN